VPANVDAGRTDPGTVQAGVMTFIATPAPGSRASRPGPASLAFVSARTGFAATTGGVHFVPREGWAPASDRGRIERTDDGGLSWRTLWSAPGVALQSIAISDKTLVASGYLARRFRCSARRGCPATEHEFIRRYVVVASSDGGVSWRRRPMPGAGTIQPLTPAIWVLSRPRDSSKPATLFRSADAGRHWRRVGLPRGADLVRFAAPALGFASARGASCPRARQLWRTVDGGRTWSAMPDTCGPPLAAVDVVSARLLFVAQADNDERAHPRSVVRRSSDGGRSWRTLWRERRRQIIRLDFVDARHGWLVENEPHAGGYAVYTRLHTSTDGGRTWSRRSLPYALSPFASGSFNGAVAAAAFFGTRRAWAGDSAAGIVWRTVDGGSTWRASAEPGSLGAPESPASVKPTLSSPGQTVTLLTAAGPVATRDGGRTWALARRPSRRAIALGTRRGGYVARGRIQTAEGHRVPSPRALRRGGAGDVAFTSARDGLVAAGDPYDAHRPVFATHDAGGTWHKVPMPWAGSPPIVLGPGIIVVDSGSRARISTDEGRSWHSFALPANSLDCGVQRPSDADIWVTCDTGVLLTSHDGGNTWTRRTAETPLDTDLAATDDHEAWAATSSTRPDAQSVFWHTTDGGATWRQAWVSLPADAPVAQLTRG
jgi:photosystem II stability/assembly factor-like uncharacterized protein